MNIEFITQCGNSHELCHFLSKPYGFEVLLRLESFGEEDADNGIDDTYDAIRFNRPRKAAFSQYCAFLRDNNAIKYQTSALKKSKTVLRLSAEVIAQLKVAREQQRASR
ncbi:MAG TPA: hypothetical protein DD440_03835 [Porticoccaceae bacterium]|nr:hypothetical protein [Porticoccaceae bacterium]